MLISLGLVLLSHYLYQGIYLNNLKPLPWVWDIYKMVELRKGENKKKRKNKVRLLLTYKSNSNLYFPEIYIYTIFY